MNSRVYIKGIVRFNNMLARFMFQEHTPEEWERMRETAENMLHKIENRLREIGAVPEDLPSQSRMAYYAIRRYVREWKRWEIWAEKARKRRSEEGLDEKDMRWKEKPAHDLRLQRISDNMADKLGLEEPVSAEFYRFTTIRLTGRLKDGVLRIRVSHLLRDAPDFVLASAVATIMFKRLGKIDAYYSNILKSYVKTNEIAERVERYRKQNARKELKGEKGRYHHLRQSFNRVNRRYFNNDIKGLTLTWGRAGRRTLGHYDHAKKTIVISSLLDSPHVPNYVLDYIMYHEMLHHVLRAHYRNGRRVIHSREFREMEKNFSQYKRAKKMIARVFG